MLPINGQHSCNGDSSHVHLQIEVSGAVYDVAVDIGMSSGEAGWYEQAMAMPGGAWSEGWHGSDSLGYDRLGVHSSVFTTLAPNALGSEVESLLANTSEISVFCTGYMPDNNGCHDVHFRDGNSSDGAIVLDPLSPTPHILFLRFATQTF